MIGYEIAKINF